MKPKKQVTMTRDEMETYERLVSAIDFFKDEEGNYYPHGENIVRSILIEIEAFKMLYATRSIKENFPGSVY